MSIRVMTAVWEKSQAKGSSLLLLLAIADFAHDDGGGAWPSIPTLAKKIRMNERTTQRLINELVITGELNVEERGGPNFTNLYRVRLENLTGGKLPGVHGGNLPPSTGGKLPGGGDKSQADMVAHVSPQSLIAEEPSWNRHAAAVRPAAAAAPQSRFDLATIEAFIHDTKPHSTNPPALARHIQRTGEEDLEIEAWSLAQDAEFQLHSQELDAQKLIASAAVERWCFGASLTIEEAQAVIAAAKRTDYSGRFEIDHCLLRVAEEVREALTQEDL